MMTLAGRTAVIDGGSGEHGFAIAEAFLAHGMNVCIVCSREPKAKIAAEKLAKYGDRLLPTWNGGINGIEAAVEKFGGVDVIVPLSGSEPSAVPIEDITLDYWNWVMKGHVTGSYLMLQKALPYFANSKAPRVLLFANDECLSGGLECGLAYNCAKGAIVSMTYTAAKLLAPKGITVNCIAVGSAYNRSVMGMAECGMTPPPELPIKAEEVPLGRLCTPEDVAVAACYLASEEAGFITGEVLNLSGGLHIG